MFGYIKRRFIFHLLKWLIADQSPKVSQWVADSEGRVGLIIRGIHISHNIADTGAAVVDPDEYSKDEFLSYEKLYPGNKVVRAVTRTHPCSIQIPESASKEFEDFLREKYILTYPGKKYHRIGDIGYMVEYVLVDSEDRKKLLSALSTKTKLTFMISDLMV